MKTIHRFLSRFVHIKWPSKKSPTGWKHYCPGCDVIGPYPCEGLK